MIVAILGGIIGAQLVLIISLWMRMHRVEYILTRWELTP